MSRLTTLPAALSFFLQSVNYSCRETLEESYQLLYMWTTPPPSDVLGLLNYTFPDPKIRAYAVQCMEEFSDEEVALYMLQLVQVVLFEFEFTEFHSSF